MKRFKLICIGIVVMIFTAIACSSCTANSKEYPGYEITRIYKYMGNSLAIYKVKTPNGTYTICRDSKGGMVILK